MDNVRAPIRRERELDQIFAAERQPHEPVDRKRQFTNSEVSSVIFENQCGNNRQSEESKREFSCTDEAVESLGASIGGVGNDAHLHCRS